MTSGEPNDLSSSDESGTAAESADPGPADSGGDSAPTRRTRRRKRKQLPIWQETILLLAIALVLAVVIKAFFVQAFYIPSESMEPGLIKNDRILVEKMSYWGDGEPQRGDVVVFEDPGGWLTEDDVQGPTNIVTKGLAKIGLYPTGGHLVKRVIGVAGDVVRCCDKKGRLRINGTPIDESGYVADDAKCAAPQVNCDLKVGPIPEGYLLVMGDNRAHSADSTFHMRGCQHPRNQCAPTRGLVKTDLVVGKVWALVWPAGRIHKMERPEAFAKVSDRE